MKPIIGIVVEVLSEADNARTGGKLSLNFNYAQAIADAGGTPVLLPPQADPSEVLPLLDGLMIPGGADIDASAWGEANHPEVEPISPERFRIEQSLYEAADPHLPIFGICYGCQRINVMRGGSLIQHLPDLAGADEHRDGVLQRYEVEPHSLLASATETEQMEGQSWHHQAIKSLGHELRVTAKTEDGTIEAVEANDRPWVVGVQWHPERSLDQHGNRELFEEFVKAAARFHEQKNSVGVWT